jgi:hypothetical protein
MAVAVRFVLRQEMDLEVFEGTKKGTPRKNRWSAFKKYRIVRLSGSYVCCRRTFCTLLNVKGNPVAFFESSETA